MMDKKENLISTRAGSASPRVEVKQNIARNLIAPNNKLQNVDTLFRVMENNRYKSIRSRGSKAKLSANIRVGTRGSRRNF